VEKNELEAKEKKMFLLTPDGTLKNVTSQAKITRSLLNSPSIDKEEFLNVLENLIKELEEELSKNPQK